MRKQLRTGSVILTGVMIGACSLFAGPSLEPDKTPLVGSPLEVVWSVPGRFTGVAAADGSPIAFATRERGELVAVDARTGSVTGTGREADIRVRVGSRQGQPMILAFSPWGSRVRAFNAAGDTLWTHDTSDGVDDAWPADLDGDGDSETVIGLNGGGGVWVLGPDGRVLWSDRSIGNVWHVTAGAMDERKLRVVTTSAAGQVHVFGTDGARIRNLAARSYATDIRFGDQPFFGGMGDTATAAVGTLDPSGWMKTFSGSIAGFAATPAIPWVAVGTRGGSVYAFRASDGALGGVVTQLGFSPEVAWSRGSAGPLLLVASSTGLTAYRVGSAPPSSPAGVR
jgi:hypothetical protein